MTSKKHTGEKRSSSRAYGGRTSSSQNILGFIGHTPMVRLKPSEDARNEAAVYAKDEAFNPTGSVKDRICLSMAEAAERSRKLKPGMMLVEPTSGNTGLGLAMVCAVKGYRLVITMPEGMSIERRALLTWFGAEFQLTPVEKGMAGAIELAHEIVRCRKDALTLQQFDNPANPEAHRRTTGPEILSQMGAKRIDAFVAGVGTGGTLTGVGEVLKKHNPRTRIIAVEPATSAVLSGHAPGMHQIQGIGAGFIPAVLNQSLIDDVIAVTDEEALRTASALAREEGLLVGTSAGANVFAARRVASTLGAGKCVVTILPDTGERYASMSLKSRLRKT